MSEPRFMDVLDLMADIDEMVRSGSEMTIYHELGEVAVVSGDTTADPTETIHASGAGLLEALHALREKTRARSDAEKAVR